MNKAYKLITVALLALSPAILADMALADTKPCPPGLAKKDPACVPPGQAKKGVTADQWQNRDRIGDVVEEDALFYLDDFDRYDLPRLPAGQRYAIVDDRIVVIDAESFRILQLIRAYQALVD